MENRERRSFLRSLIAGTSVVMLPSLNVLSSPFPAVSAIPVMAPLTASELTTWMESRFACSVGRQAAYFELLLPEAMRLYGRMDVTSDTNIVRFAYMTLAFGIEGNDPKEAEKRLTAAMIEKFEKISANQPLVWRVKPQFASDQVTEFGDTWMSKEEIEDRVDIPHRWGETEWMKRTHDRHIVQWQFRPKKDTDTVPPINVPEGVEHDFNTDSLRYVKRKYTLNKIRMRLVLPQMVNDNFADEFFTSVKDGKTIRI